MSTDPNLKLEYIGHFRDYFPGLNDKGWPHVFALTDLDDVLLNKFPEKYRLTAANRSPVYFAGGEYYPSYKDKRKIPFVDFQCEHQKENPRKIRVVCVQFKNNIPQPRSQFICKLNLFEKNKERDKFNHLLVLAGINKILGDRGFLVTSSIWSNGKNSEVALYAKLDSVQNY